MIRDDLSAEDCMTASAVFENARAEKKRKVESSDGYVIDNSIGNYIEVLYSHGIVAVSRRSARPPRRRCD